MNLSPVACPKYQTIIREQGVNLSGGQKQRLAIARALYRDPAILILDEATSALDPESEEKVQETLRWFRNHKKTIIVITHRLTSIKYCDSIIFLKQGSQQFAELMKDFYLKTRLCCWWDKQV